MSEDDQSLNNGRAKLRAASARCNICQESCTLTDDHIPPKGGIALKPVEVERAVGVFASAFASSQPRISQNGLKFKTICANCNNNILGKRYDPALNDFARSVRAMACLSIWVPDTVRIKGRPNSIARAVMGHLLAAREHDQDEFFDAEARKLLFDDSALISDELHIFYWTYPYNLQMVLRTFAMPAKRGTFTEIGVFSMLKYSPIAYLVTDCESYEGLPELTKWRHLKTDDVVDIPVSTEATCKPFWPEKPERGNFLAFGQGAYESALAKLRQKPKKT